MSPPQRGEVWKVRFDPSVGAEIGKSRPAVVVSLSTAGKLPLRIVVPLTEWKPKYVLAPWMVFVQATPMSGLTKTPLPMPSKSNPFRRRDLKPSGANCPTICWTISLRPSRLASALRSL